MDIGILVDAGEFWDRLQADVARARHRVWAQALSFEGDAVGRRFADTLAASRAADRRLIVDEYSRYWQSDRFLYRPRNLLDRQLRAEVAGLQEIIRTLGRAGVAFRFVNPFGFFFRRMADRNHKKLVLIDDDIAYLGGMNFAEHNFDWHDVMFRIEHPDVGRFVGDDFRATWDGRPPPERGRFEDLEILSLDGTDNEARLADVLGLIAGARRSVVVHNAYTTFPFWTALRKAAGRGARVTVIMPAQSNMRFMREYMAWESSRSGFETRLYPERMSHVKALLIDDDVLLAGSSNYSWLAYAFQAEFLMLIRKPEVISEFRRRVIDPDLAISTSCHEPADERLALRAFRTMRLMARIGRIISPRLPHRDRT